MTRVALWADGTVFCALPHRGAAQGGERLPPHVQPKATEGLVHRIERVLLMRAPPGAYRAAIRSQRSMVDSASPTSQCLLDSQRPFTSAAQTQGGARLARGGGTAVNLYRAGGTAAHSVTWGQFLKKTAPKWPRASCLLWFDDSASTGARRTGPCGRSSSKRVPTEPRTSAAPTSVACWKRSGRLPNATTSATTGKSAAGSSSQPGQPIPAKPRRRSAQEYLRA